MNNSLKDEISKLRSQLYNATSTTTDVNNTTNTTNVTNVSNGSNPSKELTDKTIKNLEEKENELKERAEKFAVLDNQISNLLNSKDTNICLNIGGELFYTKLSTILSEKDTLLYKLIAYKIQKNMNLEESIFIDRNPTYFNDFLNYLRTKKFSLQNYNQNEIEDIKIEAEFFGISPIYEKILEFEKEVVFVHFESSPQYSTCGTHRLEDLSDRSLTKGICVQTPYHIIVELNHPAQVDLIEIGGYNGNVNAWAPSNGSGAKIYTSLDKITWTEVGVIPSNYSSVIVQTKLKSSLAKYLKFQHNTYLGIGYLKVTK